MWANEDIGCKKPTNSGCHLRVLETKQHCLTIMEEKDGFTPATVVLLLSPDTVLQKEKMHLEENGYGEINKI